MNDVTSLFFNNAQCPDSMEILDTASIISTVAAASRACNQSMIVIDYDEHKSLYMSESMIYLEEATETDFKRKCENPYWSLVSDITLDKLLSVKNAYYNLSKQMGRVQYGSHICVLDYPISIRNHDFFINQTFTPLCLRSDDIIGVGLFTFRPSAKREISCIVLGSDGRRWSFDFQDKQFLEYHLGVHLTPTEKAILQRARKGMTNGEIAKNLFITESTVKTHKLRIFHKLHVTTIAEALVIVGNYHLL